jgi:hypothetical protein
VVEHHTSTKKNSGLFDRFRCTNLGARNLGQKQKMPTSHQTEFSNSTIRMAV